MNCLAFIIDSCFLYRFIGRCFFSNMKRTAFWTICKLPYNSSSPQFISPRSHYLHHFCFIPLSISIFPTLPHSWLQLSLCLIVVYVLGSMTSYDVRRLVVRLGDHNIRREDDADHEEYGVLRIIRHKGFSDQTLVRTMPSLTWILS